jgi:hypothetical protein
MNQNVRVCFFVNLRIYLASPIGHGRRYSWHVKPLRTISKYAVRPVRLPVRHASASPRQLE